MSPSISVGGRVPYVARFTRLHFRLWGPYGITAYPTGFHDWPEHLSAAVWMPEARIITGAGAVKVPLGDCATLDDAIAACWSHFASLH